jgi:hypothetical protein
MSPRGSTYQRPAAMLRAGASSIFCLMVGCDLSAMDADRPELGTDEQEVSCTPSLSYYPVRGRHNNGYDPTAGNPSQWTCDAAHSNSDYTPGSHLGNDIWAAEGTPVVATVSGTFRLVGWSDYAGYKVTIADSCGYYHYSAHLQRIAPGVANGGQATAGQVIGYVGKTGTASNGVVHLHYSIYPAGNYDTGIDPYPHLRAVEQNVCNLGVPHSIAVGDLNNDGKNDLTGRLSNSDVWFSPNLGGGNGITWGAGWLIAGGSGFTDIAVGDLNSDGKKDLIGRLSNGDVWFSPNLGGGNGITWGAGWLIAGGSGFTDIAVGDLNNDGKNDLIGRLSNGDVWFTPNLGGGNGITWGTGWLIAGSSGF